MTTQPENTNGNKEQSQLSYGIDADQPISGNYQRPQFSEAGVGGQDPGAQAAYSPNLQKSARNSKYLGICSIVLSGIGFFIFSILAIAGIIVGIVGLVMGNRAAKEGADTSTSKVLSIIGISLGALTVVTIFRELVYIYYYY